MSTTTSAAIAAVVALAKACGMRSLAEGVETADQLSPWLEAHRTARERARRELSGAQLSLAAR
jgi:sensor c-di-GMP phosphodiesterase-like protein